MKHDLREADYYFWSHGLVFIQSKREAWDATAKVTVDRALLNELTSLTG